MTTQAQPVARTFTIVASIIVRSKDFCSANWSLDEACEAFEDHLDTRFADFGLR